MAWKARSAKCLSRLKICFTSGLILMRLTLSRKSSSEDGMILSLRAGLAMARKIPGMDCSTLCPYLKLTVVLPPDVKRRILSASVLRAWSVDCSGSSMSRKKLESSLLNSVLPIM